MHKLCVRQRVCTVQHNSSVRNTICRVQHNSSVRQRISIVQHNGPLRQRTPDVQYDRRVYQRTCMSTITISCIRWYFISNFIFNSTNMRLVYRWKEMHTGWEWLILVCRVNSSYHKHWRKDSCLKIERSWMLRLAGITMAASGVPSLIISTQCSSCWSIIAWWNVNKLSTLLFISTAFSLHPHLPHPVRELANRFVTSKQEMPDWSRWGHLSGVQLKAYFLQLPWRTTLGRQLCR